MELRTVPFHRAANRATLFLGGDREMVMFSGLLATALIFTALSWAAFIYGVLLWFITLFLFRLMAKSDPQLRQVYLRHRRYKGYYPARSTPFRSNPASQAAIYKKP
jgi:type IV secretion system protein VirB3